jgi:hypothetical protein
LQELEVIIYIFGMCFLIVQFSSCPLSVVTWSV